MTSKWTNSLFYSTVFINFTIIITIKKFTNFSLTDILMDFQTFDLFYLIIMISGSSINALKFSLKSNGISRNGI